MNISPEWVTTLSIHGWNVRHWISVGDPRASDSEIAAWARLNGYVIITYDLDFGAILAMTKAAGPSVVLIRANDLAPAHLDALIVIALRNYETQLESGALLVIDEARQRIRLLPLGSS